MALFQAYGIEARKMVLMTLNVDVILDESSVPYLGAKDDKF